MTSSKVLIFTQKMSDSPFCEDQTTRKADGDVVYMHRYYGVLVLQVSAQFWSLSIVSGAYKMLSLRRTLSSITIIITFIVAISNEVSARSEACDANVDHDIILGMYCRCFDIQPLPITEY
jgi:hypothetical protein